MIFGVSQKPLSIKGSKMARSLKKENFLAYLGTWTVKKFQVPLVFQEEPFQFPKEFLDCIGCISSFLPKFNSRLKLVSDSHFLHIFLGKLSLRNTFIFYQVSISDPFLLLKILNNLHFVIPVSTRDDIINFMIFLQSTFSINHQWREEEKERKMEVRRTKGAFSVKAKAFFHNFLIASFGEIY